MDTLGTRIRQLRETRKLKQTELANLIEVNSGAVISNWEKGLNKPDVEKLVLLCEALHTTPGYLLCYENKFEPMHLGPHEEVMINQFRALDDFGQEAVETLLSIESQRCATRTDGPAVQANPQPNAQASPVLPFSRRGAQRNDLISMPIYTQKASAGIGNYLFDNGEEDYELMEFDPAAVPNKADFGIIIKGDSMEPIIKDGNIVWVKPQPAVEDGEIGIFVLNGEAYCKKLYLKAGHMKLLSLNPQYKPIGISEFDTIQTVGKVLLS